MFESVAPELILWPVAAHLALVVYLYVWLTAARAIAVSKGETAYNDFQFGDGDSPSAARVSRNLSNQFEAPVLFYALAAILFAADAVTPAQLALAWLFIAGRLAHTMVQTLTGNVRLRGQIFTINFLALIAMWALFLYSRLVQ